MTSTVLAAKRRKNAAHGASRGPQVGNEQAPKGRKNSSHAHKGSIFQNFRLLPQADRVKASDGTALHRPCAKCQADCRSSAHPAGPYPEILDSKPGEQTEKLPGYPPKSNVHRRSKDTDHHAPWRV